MTQRGRVLVIDDAPETLGLLDAALEQAGYVVLMAQNAYAAFTAIDRNQPDIILIDAVMPGMSGLEACIRLKASPALAAIPVIFMTGLSETEHVVQAFEAASGRPIPYEVVARRPGDIDASYADPALAQRLLNWRATHDLRTMCEDSWRWQNLNPNGFDNSPPSSTP